METSNEYLYTEVDRLNGMNTSLRTERQLAESRVKEIEAAYLEHKNKYKSVTSVMIGIKAKLEAASKELK